jgi:hypothetical protein
MSSGKHWLHEVKHGGFRVPPHIDVPALAAVVVATDKASSNKAANNRSTNVQE